MKVILNSEEVEALFHQPAESKPDGGFQYLLIRLQEKFEKDSSSLDLDEADFEKIRKYALDYGRGGYETRLAKIFGRIMGSRFEGPESI